LTDLVCCCRSLSAYDGEYDLEASPEVAKAVAASSRRERDGYKVARATVGVIILVLANY
jgi:hypothetical protein